MDDTILSLGLWLLLALGLYLLFKNNEQEIDSALEEAIPDAAKRAIAKTLLSDEQTREFFIKELAPMLPAA